MSSALAAPTGWQGPQRFALGARGRGLDTTTAYWMGRMAELAYAPRDQIVRTLADLGVSTDHFAYFENTKTSTQGFYFAAGTDAVLAFRGTQELKDFLVDAKAWTRKTPMGNVHAGFLGSFESVWTDAAPGLGLSDGSLGLRSLLRAEQIRGRRRLLVTGHSLGAALATLAYAHAAYDDCLRPVYAGDARSLEERTLDQCFERGIDVNELYTFGSPRVGDATFAGWVSAHAEDPSRDRGIFRFVQAADAVAKVPDTFGGELFFHPSSLSVTGKQTEHDNLVYLSRGGQLDLGGSSIEYTSDKWRARWRDYVGDHFMAGYLRTLLAHAAEGRAPTVALATAQKERFGRVKAAYESARPEDFAPVAASELGGTLAMSTPGEVVLQWKTNVGTFYVRRTTDGAAPPDDTEEEVGHVPIDVSPIDVDEIFDGGFELVATVELDRAQNRILRVEDPNDPSRR